MSPFRPTVALRGLCAVIPALGDVVWLVRSMWLMRRSSAVSFRRFFLLFLFFPLTFSVACPTGPHPPLRLARRPNRGHIGGAGLDPLLRSRRVFVCRCCVFLSPLCIASSWERSCCVQVTTARTELSATTATDVCRRCRICMIPYPAISTWLAWHGSCLDGCLGAPTTRRAPAAVRSLDCLFSRCLPLWPATAGYRAALSIFDAVLVYSEF